MKVSVRENKDRSHTALPTLNQQHSSPVHPAPPLLFLPVQEDSECCSPHPLQMYRPAVAVGAGTDTKAGTRETAHAQNAGCSYLLRLWQLVRDMDEHINEHMNGGMDQRQERLAQRKRTTRQGGRNKMQKKPCSKQMPVAALGCVTLYTTARGGKFADKINFPGN